MIQARCHMVLARGTDEENVQHAGRAVTLLELDSPDGATAAAQREGALILLKVTRVDWAKARVKEELAARPGISEAEVREVYGRYGCTRFYPHLK